MLLFMVSKKPLLNAQKKGLTATLVVEQTLWQWHVRYSKTPVESPSAHIHAAYRLRTKAPGPRPLLVSFTSKALRTAVVTATRRPKQTLTFNGSKIYINDHLTSNSAEIFRKARRLVKDKEASATWTRDGLIFIKWTDNGKPTRVRMLSDLD
jgi:hypothetical protein